MPYDDIMKLFKIERSTRQYRFVANATIPAGRLITVTATGSAVSAITNSLDVIGVEGEQDAHAAGEGFYADLMGVTPLVAAEQVDEGRPLKAYMDGRAGEAVDATKAGYDMVHQDGDLFTNQPAGSMLCIDTYDAADDISVVVYGETVAGGACTQIRTKLVAADSKLIGNFSNVLAIVCEEENTGAIIAKLATGAATVVAIAATGQVAGFALPADSRAFNLIPNLTKEGANANAHIVTMGYTTEGVFQSDIDVMGAARTSALAAAYNQIIAVLIGDVHSADSVLLEVGAEEDENRIIGKSLTAASARDETFYAKLN